MQFAARKRRRCHPSQLSGHATMLHPTGGHGMMHMPESAIQSACEASARPQSKSAKQHSRTGRHARLRAMQCMKPAPNSKCCTRTGACTPGMATFHQSKGGIQVACQCTRVPDGDRLYQSPGMGASIYDQQTQREMQRAPMIATWLVCLFIIKPKKQ